MGAISTEIHPQLFKFSKGLQLHLLEFSRKILGTLTLLKLASLLRNLRNPMHSLKKIYLQQLTSITFYALLPTDIDDYEPTSLERVSRVAMRQI